MTAPAAQDSCYSDLHTLHYDRPLFVRIPVTFVITTPGATARQERVLRELDEVRPTRRCVVVENKTYLGCCKPGVRTPMEDLLHANQEVCRRALREGHAWVLVLEDDARFRGAALREAAARVESFVCGRAAIGSGAERSPSPERDEVEMYSLGSSPFLSHPLWGQWHLRTYCAGNTHAVIYSRSGMRRVLAHKHRFLHDIEISCRLRTYCSRVPLAVQTRETTTNSSHWDLTGGAFVSAEAMLGDSLFDLYHALAHAGGVLPVGVAVLALVTAVTVASAVALTRLISAQAVLTVDPAPPV